MIDPSCWSPYLQRVWLNLAICLVILTSMTACQAVNSTKEIVQTTPQNSPERQISTLPASTANPEKTPTPVANIPVHASQTPTEPTPVPSRSVPPVWDFISENFEDGSLARWGQISESNLSLAPGGGRNGSTGLSVTVHKRETYLYITDIVKTTEGYFTFWFNPNSVNIPDQPDLPIRGKSIRIADIKGYKHYDVIASLRIWKPNDSGQDYKAYLEWQADDGSHFDLDSGQFDLANGWQKITLGFRINDWVAVWVNNVLVRQVTGIQHSESFGEIVEFGKANDDISITPVGAMRYDEVAFQIPRIADLWVDAANGNDDNTGLERSAAFRTIQKAANLAGPGTKVHILPGIYRESVSPASDGSPTESAVYTAEAGPGTVIIRGSEPSKSLTWQQLQSNTIGLPAGVDPSQIYYTDLSGWKLDGPPRFLVEVDDQGNVMSRLALAHEPDWPVKTEWKYHEFWWSADGGSVKTACNPATDANPNCDIKSRSMTKLSDSTDDTDPQGIEPGNLSTLGDLTGATLVAIDSLQGHYVYRRTIISHDVPSGRITVDRKCEHDDGSGDPGLGWGTKYYVEGKPSLLDTPGEWWYDNNNGLLYLWSPSSTSPANLNIEISRQETGFNLSQRSNITVDGLTLEFFNGSAVYAYNEPNRKSSNNTVRNVTLRYADHGLYLYQGVGDNAENNTSHFTLEQSEIAYMDSDAVNLSYTWKNESAPASFTFAGITDTVIRGNQLHHLGFRTDRDNANGVSFRHADRLRFEDNHVHHVAHNGVQFSWSIIQSQKSYGFSPDEIKTGEILVNDNIFEQACQLTTDCGALKFWGDPPNGHVYRDVLITGNVFRNTFGWSSISEKRRRWNGGSGSDVRGMGGFGLYLDMASGFHVYRNIAYNNAFAGVSLGGVWRDGDMVFCNNIIANSLYGFFFSGLGFDTHSNVNTQVVNNILVNNEADGLWFTDNGKFSDVVFIDYNLYSNNGWRPYQLGGVSQPGALIIRRAQDSYETYQTLADIQAKTSWEAHGLDGDAGFLQYDLYDHNLYDGSWPDFHVSAASSNVIDRGTESLPASLTRLLEKFGVQDHRTGSAYDIGRYELSGSEGASASQENSSGGTARLFLEVYGQYLPVWLAGWAGNWQKKPFLVVWKYVTEIKKESL